MPDIIRRPKRLPVWPQPSTMLATEARMTHTTGDRVYRVERRPYPDGLTVREYRTEPADPHDIAGDMIRVMDDNGRPIVCVPRNVLITPYSTPGQFPFAGSRETAISAAYATARARLDEAHRNVNYALGELGGLDHLRHQLWDRPRGEPR